MSKKWTSEEIDYLANNWGTVSIGNIAKKLGRSDTAITLKAQRIGLGAFLENGEYITLNQLIIAVTGSAGNYSYKNTSWVKNRGLPVRKKKVGKCYFRVVYIDDFWEWAEKNRSFIDFSKMTPLILGAEPEWVTEQRKKDFKSLPIQRKDRWTKAEDSRLKVLLGQYKYTYAELSRMLGRTNGAIQRRCTDLGIKERPIKADTHGVSAKWTQAMYDTVAECIISEKIDKSEKAIRGKVYSTYLTENLDKVRAMLGIGKWGDGAPEPSVRQAQYLPKTRTKCLRSVTDLIAVLKYRRNSLAYGPYWQRHMCVKWDDYEGCTAGGAGCDDCAEFERIKPQYCARCGATFYERKENRFCAQCRTARKKQAQKRWSRINGRR